MAGALGAFQGHNATNIPLLCAGTILILLPTLIIFVLFQRQIITALLQGSVKGESLSYCIRRIQYVTHVGQMLSIAL